MAKLFRSADVNIVVYVLVIIFGTGSWVAVNGLWMEVPLLVQDLPEAWNLPSFLVIIIQIANIGPLAYAAVRKFCQSYILDQAIVYLLVIVGAVSCFLLVFFWDRTVFVAGSERSVALFVLTLCLATVDCTSSVVFLPFMFLLKAQYMTAFFIGEGLSGLVPSLVALLQGGNMGAHCVNVTINGSDTKLVPLIEPPLFGVDVFFGFLFVLMLLCGLAFASLNHSPVCKREHVTLPWTTVSPQASTSSSNEEYNYETTPDSIFYKPVKTEEAIAESQDSPTVIAHSAGESCRSIEPLQPRHKTMTKPMYVYLLILTAWVNAIGNGFLPSIQSYASLPYGQMSYHLAVTLSSIANPLTCFLLFIIPTTSKKLVSVLTILVSALLCYIVFLASQSPNPPLGDNIIGKILMVTACIVISAILSGVKLTLASILRETNANALFWYGALTQVGSALGALVAFLLVNTFQLFRSKAPCT